jgi:hypothetical protein
MSTAMFERFDDALASLVPRFLDPKLLLFPF